MTMTKPRNEHAVSLPEPDDLLLEGLSKHAGPAWVASHDLKSITANSAARARIDSHAAQCDPHRPEIARRRLTRIYEQSLRSALITAAQTGNSRPDAEQPCLPHHVSCTVRGEKLELLVLEVRTTSLLPRDASQAVDREQTVAYLLVA
jgi:hypothetical protein